MNPNGKNSGSQGSRSGSAPEGDLEFLYGHMSEYADGDLNTSETQRCKEISAAIGEPQLVSRYRAVRGKLQLALQGYYLSEDEVVALQDYVADRQVRETQEAKRMDEIERWESKGEVKRKIAIFSLVCAIVFGIVYFLTPAKTKKINPLDYFGYEAHAFEEDPEGRLNLPSEDFNEISAFFRNYPSLGFTVTPPSPQPGWTPVGATVIDYDISKVAEVVYRNNSSRELLFFFAYKGSFTDIPRAEQGNERGLIYQVYTSDRQNLLAWQSGESVLSFMIGKGNAKDLASFAKGN